MSLPSITFTIFMALARIATFIAVFPLFHGRNLPNTVKVGLAIALAGSWFLTGLPSTGVAPGPDGEWGSMSVWVFAAARETLLGGALGFAMGLFLLPMQVAGAFIAQEMGLSMASQADPTGQGSSTVVNQLFLTLGMLLFFALDLHHDMLRVLHVSFFTRPIGAGFELPSPHMVLGGLSDAHTAGLLLSLPAVAALFIGLVTLLVTARTAPQLNMFTIGFPMRVAIGLVAVVVFFPEMCLLGLRAMSRLTNVASW
jgi:flagellar biosynthesis protein FliR